MKIYCIMVDSHQKKLEGHIFTPDHKAEGGETTMDENLSEQVLVVVAPLSFRCRERFWAGDCRISLIRMV